MTSGSTVGPWKREPASREMVGPRGHRYRIRSATPADYNGASPARRADLDARPWLLEVFFPLPTDPRLAKLHREEWVIYGNEPTRDAALKRQEFLRRTFFEGEQAEQW